MDYLGQANRFSRSPSHVAEYLGTTRGTVSQSFKSLVQKGYVTEHRSKFDKRIISFELTASGKGHLKRKQPSHGCTDRFYRQRKGCVPCLP
ncbi:MAG: MarR family winged helix-turn-helix transcriptional regulator [Paracoccaceae bacterium]|nr:MarR family winged helix-turn-helix transcriptional regulator [Paracoccaceae bacterium]MDG1736602.1 MarR family winged helix-turn-helix transcriptional regulator [Paracoccaceae bacterium]MDG2257315.1 MarR family winged helix-turn-helix transcriptional regulator [Paracoccaceae bacterium]